MAFNTFLAGDRFGQRSTSNVPKTFAVARYTAPVVGDLVKQDTTATFNSGVVACSASDVPRYLVESINSWASGVTVGTLSCWLLAKTCQLVFQYSQTSTPTLGHQIQADPLGTPSTGSVIKIAGFTRMLVKDVASPNGIGLIVAIDQPVTGLMVVEFAGGLT